MPVGCSPPRLRPRAIRNDTPAGQLLLSLEIPECNCPVFSGDGERRKLLPPCRHVLESGGRDAGQTMGEWAELLRGYDPVGHGVLPRARGAALALTHAARVELYCLRRAAHVSLWHDADHLEDEDLDVETCRRRRVAGLRSRRGMR